MSRESICAIVVTYNRKELLLNCLHALLEQSFSLSHIVIVNNASTDGTIDFLAKNGFINNSQFTLLNLPENQGGAGGFYEGIKFAHDNKFDYVWMMDDDGYPDKDCLKNLIPYLSTECYIGPILLDPKTQDKLSFALRIPNSLEIIDNYSNLSTDIKEKNIIEQAIIPFNGTLISMELIKKMGFPIKDYFIWGDEREYTLRAKKYQAKILTVVNSIFYHPLSSSISEPMFFGKLRFNNANSLLKQYCFCRNSFAIFLRYKGFFYAFAFASKAIWFYAFTKPCLKKLKLTLRALWHALRKDFNHHKEYLK